MGDLVGFLRQVSSWNFARGFRVQAEVELVFPAELEARAADGVVAQARGRVALGEVGGVGGDACR
jgi:hypothetical protein